MKEDNSGNVLGYWIVVKDSFFMCSNCGCISYNEYPICPICNTLMNLYNNKDRKE